MRHTLLGLAITLLATTAAADTATQADNSISDTPEPTIGAMVATGNGKVIDAQFGGVTHSVKDCVDQSVAALHQAGPPPAGVDIYLTCTGIITGHAAVVHSGGHAGGAQDEAPPATRGEASPARQREVRPAPGQQTTDL